MKVFISHQSADSFTAKKIADHLQHFHGIPSYLDVIDPYIGMRGEDLAAHIRTQMGQCTQLLAVVSYNTASSQWVPWEIGVATGRDYPLATYANSSVPPPEFLRKWPYLRSVPDLDRYAVASKAAWNLLLQKRPYLHESTARQDSTQEFYRMLRRSLNQ
ncbi:toll/interleukin-1 receptor domain-containing protein [Komagataeibacter nataicola]|uniref:TIR domain-containing protein n=1 Tax=Komagataeibacter nataicola TaxID=265960 RepID=A0ABX5PCZ0_9PROT|nr:toll/interleukin-1 receptor domain-containing protein [Komagataeibacter nataicola]PYD65187.1 hypothetical protein CDI09_14935 [Komagataeibacter nataicola]GBR21931.1 hypothetical protein AA0616_2150 [Komagataeibacter nataicola NRIC 0616]